MHFKKANLCAVRNCGKIEHVEKIKDIMNNLSKEGYEESRRLRVSAFRDRSLQALRHLRRQCTKQYTGPLNDKKSLHK